jgi:DNA-binding beta-propeller fold protein YncE
LFVTGYTNNRVTVYNVSSITDGQNAVNVLGQVNFTAFAAANTQAGMYNPSGLAYNSGGSKLYVSGYSNNRITVYDVSSITNGANAVDVLGQVNFTGYSGSAGTQEKLSSPTGLDYDSGGNRLFVSAGARVAIFDTTVTVFGRNAKDALGQYNDSLSDPQPIFTKSLANDAPNRLGLIDPQAVEIDTVNHKLFVADSSNNRVLIYNLNADNTLPDRIPDYVLGQSNFYTNSTGTSQAGLYYPYGLACDSARMRLFIADYTNNRVVLHNISSIVNGQNASFVLGQATFTSSTAANTQAGMYNPYGVAYDSIQDRLYVPGFTNHRVTTYDVAPNPNNQNAVDLLGQYDNSLSDPQPIYTKAAAHNAPNRLGLNYPSYVALDGTNHRLFVTDATNNRILIYNLNTDNTFPDRIPDNVLGQPNFYSNTSAASQVGMSTPYGLAYDSSGNRLFVADSTNNRVTVYNVSSITDGENAVNVLGQLNFTAASSATTQPGVNRPHGLAYDSSGNRLFVADNTNNRVTVYNVSSITDGQNAVNVLGQANFTVGTAANTQAGMNAPGGLAYDSSGNRLFVGGINNARVTVYDVSSITDGENAVNVLGQVNFTAFAAANTQAGMNGPYGLAYDSAGNRLFVALNLSNRVTVYDVSSITDGENAVNVLGQVNFTEFAAATTQAGMSGPRGLAYDSAGNRLIVVGGNNYRVTVYDVSSITDGENAVDLLGQNDNSLIDPHPVFTKATAHDAPNRLGLNGPTAVAIDASNHRLFVSDLSNSRVLVYNLNTDNTFPDRIPDNVIGQPNFYSNAGSTSQAGLNSPYGLAYDGTQNRLFVSSDHRITVYNVSSITDGQNAVNVLGQVNFTGSAGGVTQAGLSGPRHLAFDSNGSRLFVANYTGNRVTVYDVSSITNGQNALNVLGQTNFTTSTAANTQAGMSGPMGLAYDSSGNRLFVAAYTNHRVTVYDVSSITNGQNALNVLGQTNFTAFAAANTQTGMNNPISLAYDSSGNRLFVAGYTNNRVTVYDASTITDGENASIVLGQTNFTGYSAASTQTGLSGPYGLAYDAVSGRLFTVENTGHRVKVFSMGTSTTPPAKKDHMFWFEGF